MWLEAVVLALGCVTVWLWIEVCDPSACLWRQRVTDRLLRLLRCS
jgi:hypothetical protein